MAYAFQPTETKRLVPATAPFTKVVPGSGPRHLTFHPNGKYAYLVEEMAGAVVVYNYDKTTGRFDSLQQIFTHPEGAKAPFGAADIHIPPDGKFLYVSNRANENNIAIFSISPSGKLKNMGYQSTLGKVPRNFTLDPSGKFLLVANQESDNVVVFKRNNRTGIFTTTGIQISIPEPTCLKMKNCQ